MASILKLIPMIISIIKRTRNLAGAMSSTTTQVQWAATLIVCAIVATIGAFMPQLAQDEIAQGAAVFLIGIVGPMLSRIIGKKDTGSKAGWMRLVKRAGVEEWEVRDMTLLDAQSECYELGVDADNNIWDIKTASKTGIEYKSVWRKHLEDRLAELKAGPANND